MSQISVTNLTYCYEGSFDNIFENVSFTLDTDWKLGFIGRNGKGKTTFLDILMGKYLYSGSITTSSRFDYFPYEITPDRLERCAAEFMEELKAGCEEWKVIRELEKLGTDAELLFRPFGTLSHGERTKVLLAILFSEESDFLLIDEPTNHLDQKAREVVKQYLSGKKGFILVSHDRDILDACVDHVLVLNRKTIEVQNGHFSSWWENKNRADNFAKAENEKHIREIGTLKKAADRSRRWAEKSENTKIGFDPQKEHDRNIATRAYIGSKTKKMQSRVKQYERRIENEIQEKEGLLQDIENPTELKLNPMQYHKEILVACKDLSVAYSSGKENVLSRFSFDIKQGERIFLHGENGCGKSTLIKTILAQSGRKEEGIIITGGEIRSGAGIIISYIDQDTGSICGTIDDFCRNRNLEKSLFLSLLRQLDLERVQFTKRLEDFSEGQKKKVLIASSLMIPAHLYIWDEPLNYIDVFSRMQIENLIMKYQPTMLLVDHDIRFQEKIATRVIEMP